MKTTLQLKFFTCIVILSMINANSQNNENDTTELTNWTHQYTAEEGGYLKWQNISPEQALDNDEQVKLFLNAKLNILYLEFSETIGKGVLKQIHIYGMEGQQLLFVKQNTDSQFAVDVSSLNYKGIAIIEVKTKENTYLLNTVLN